MITDKYGVVEFHDKKFKSGASRSDETKRGSPSSGFEKLPIASALNADL
jgi:hypothetical protein